MAETFKIFSTCSKITLDRFLDCLFDKDLQQLVIEGNPPTEVLEDAWQHIYLEYLELSQSKSYNESFEKSKEINKLRAQLAMVDNICLYLQIQYDSSMVEMLDKLGLKSGITGNETAPQLFVKLKLVITKAKKWLVQIEKKRSELETLQENTKEVIDGRGAFDDTLGALTMFMKVYVKASDYTVSRYCRDVQRMVEAAQRAAVKK